MKDYLQKNVKNQVVLLFVVLLVSISIAFALAPLPCDFYGGSANSAVFEGVTYGGQVIEAYDANDVFCGSIRTNADGSFPLLTCSGDDPATGADEGATSGDTIRFYLYGDRANCANGDCSWTSTETHEIRLESVNEPPYIITMNGPSGTYGGNVPVTVTTNTQDPDHEKGTRDQVRLFVCKTNVATDNVGCVPGQEYCNSGYVADDPTCGWNTEFDNNNHNYYVFVMDEHGLISSPGVAGSYTTDIIPPNITATNPVNDSWLNDPNPTMYVNTDEPSTCKYATSPGVAYDAKPVTMNGLTQVHSSGLNLIEWPFQNWFYIQCEDPYGNRMDIGNEYGLLIKLDTEAPTPGSVLVENGDHNTTNSTLDFTWTGYADQVGKSGIAGYYYSTVDNSGTTTGTYDLSSPGQLISVDGNISVYVWAVDNAGNIGAAESDDILVDTTGPVFSNFQNDPIRMSDTGSMTVNVTITDAVIGLGNNFSIRYRYAGGLWSDWYNLTNITSNIFTYEIPDADWSTLYNQLVDWEFYANDKLGHETIAPMNWRILGGDPDSIVIKKNIIVQNQDNDSITYYIRNTIYNTRNDTDFSNFFFIDNDINTSGETMSLVKGEVAYREANVTISKDAINKNHTFSRALIVEGSDQYFSNEPIISIPGYGGPFDIMVDVPPIVPANSDVTALIELLNMNEHIAKDVQLYYWISDGWNNVLVGKDMISIFTPSQETVGTYQSLRAGGPGTYRFWAEVVWTEGQTASAYDTFVVEGGSSGGGGGGGGGFGDIKGGHMENETENDTNTVYLEKVKTIEKPTQIVVYKGVHVEQDINTRTETSLNNFVLKIDMKNWGNHSTDVTFDYLIRDENYDVVYSEKGKKFELDYEKSFSKRFPELGLKTGNYTIYVDVHFLGVTEQFTEEIEIVEEILDYCYILSPSFKCWYMYIVASLVALFVIITLWPLNYYQKIKTLLQKSTEEIEKKEEELLEEEEKLLAEEKHIEDEIDELKEDIRENRITKLVERPEDLNINVTSAVTGSDVHVGVEDTINETAIKRAETLTAEVEEKLPYSKEEYDAFAYFVEKALKKSNELFNHAYYSEVQNMKIDIKRIRDRDNFVKMMKRLNDIVSSEEKQKPDLRKRALSYAEKSALLSEVEFVFDAYRRTTLINPIIEKSLKFYQLKLGQSIDGDVQLNALDGKKIEYHVRQIMSFVRRHGRPKK